MPPRAVPCPPSHFVNECTTISAPCSKGRSRYGVAKVASTTRGSHAAWRWRIPHPDLRRPARGCRWPPRTRRASAVDGGFHLVKILRLHEACRDPELGQDVVEQGERSAVQVVRRDDFVPCFARLTIVEKMADVPDAEANAPTPPSNRLIRSSSMAAWGCRAAVDIPLFGKAKKFGGVLRALKR